jgi:putative hydrolase of the HAD superfamily
LSAPPRRRRAAPGASAAAPRRTVWLLDLDNTLHDAVRSILPRIDAAMTAFVMRETALDEAAASALRLHYWRRYGATMLGMIRHHGTDFRAFLRDTHPADLHESVRRDVRLMHLLRRLPGRKIVLTNAPADYAGRVVGALGIRPLIDGLVSIEAMRFAGRMQPKPSRPMLRKLLARIRVPAGRCVLVEDTVENLRAARHCGVRTVWVSGIAWRARAAWLRPRRGQRGIDVHVRSVVQLARTPLARPVHEHPDRFARRSG